MQYARGETIFTQGDACEHVMYVQSGGVKLSVLSETGREAVVAMLGPGDFFGEGCLAGQPVRMGSATAITPSAILRVAKARMVRLLHKQHAMSDRFIAHMLARNIRIEEDLVDQLFNSSEKRLARTLLLLARYGKQDKPARVVPKIPGNARRDDRHDALAREFLPEQVQEARLHRVRRRASRSKSTARCWASSCTNAPSGVQFGTARVFPPPHTRVEWLERSPMAVPAGRTNRNPGSRRGGQRISRDDSRRIRGAASPFRQVVDRCRAPRRASGVEVHRPPAIGSRADLALHHAPD